MNEETRQDQLRGVNLYNWTQQAWDKAAKDPNLVGVKKWSDLGSEFQRYLLEKTKGCTTKEATEKALKR